MNERAELIYPGLGFTDLILAAGQENLEDVEALLKNGADVNAASKFGQTALWSAARYAYKDRETAIKIVTFLLDSGASINAQKFDGESALMACGYYNYLDILKLLIERGADVNLRRQDGNTAISSIEVAPSLVRSRKTVLKILRDAGGIP